jgi:O-antigen ligase
MGGQAAARYGGYLTTLTVLSLLPVVLLVLDTGLDLLPPDPVLGVFTVSRVLLIVGLVAVFAQGARLRDLRTDLDWVLAALLVAVLLTTWSTGFGAAELRGLLEQLAFFYLVVACIRRNEWTDGIPLVALIAVVAAAGVGVAQFMQDTPTTFYREGFASVTSTEPRPDLLVRAVGTFANPNLLAAYVLLLVPFAVLAAARATELEHRTVVGVCAGIAFVGLVVSWSRAGLTGLALAGAVALMTWWAMSPRYRTRARVGAIVLGVAGVALVGVAVAGLLGRFANRDDAWRLALQVAADHPLFGVGLGRAGDVMNAVGDPQLPYFHTHNLWLNWLVEAGPVAAVAMVAVFGLSLWVGVRRAATGSGLALAGLVGLAGFVIPSLVDHPANLTRIAFAFWFVLATIHAPLRRVRPPRDGRSARGTQRPPTVTVDPRGTRDPRNVRDPRLDDTITTVARPGERSHDPYVAVRPPRADRRA